MEGKTVYYTGKDAGNWHKPNMCDRCQKPVGKKNLKAVSFLYMDKNDRFHPDMSSKIWNAKRKQYEQMTDDEGLVNLMMMKTYIERGYRQYYCCKECWE